MSATGRPRVAAILLALAAGFGLSRAAGAQSPGEIVDRTELRVCADPSNLPFSNEKGEGFENKTAQLLADELKLKLSAGIRGFVANNSLNGFFGFGEYEGGLASSGEGSCVTPVVYNQNLPCINVPDKHVRESGETHLKPISGCGAWACGTFNGRPKKSTVVPADCPAVLRVA